MKQRMKKLMALGLSVVMLTSLVTPALAYDTFSTAPAKEMKLLNENGREVTFVDLYNGQTEKRPDTSDEIVFYMDAIENNGVFQDWVTLGYLIHETNRGSYSDLAGSGWDKDFGKGHYMDYIYDMPIQMAAADLVISRAGAMSISELALMGKASVLIPSPYVAENHQYHNAMALVNNGAAEILEEKDLTPEKLTDMVNDLIHNKSKLENIGKCAKDMAVIDATARIYDTLCEIVRVK